MSTPDAARARRSRVQAFVESISLKKAVLSVVFVAIGIGALGAMLLRLVNPGAFTGVGDGVWLAVVTVTTVGFGDVVPTNTAGRVVTATLALLGISLIPTLTSLVTAILVTRYQQATSEAREAEQEEILALVRRIEARLERLETGSR